jgi:pantetheine-phosphate adenylyltransferase
MIKIAVYPGTFDPITNGHIDIIERAIKIFDKVIITVSKNVGKQPLFTASERLELVKKVTEKYPNVEVDFFDGLIADYAKQRGAIALIRGLRALSDFEYEFQMALMNRKMSEAEITTVFLMPHEKYTYLNSTIVREVASFGRDVSFFVPPYVAEQLKKKFNRSGSS